MIFLLSAWNGKFGDFSIQAEFLCKKNFLEYNEKAMNFLRTKLDRMIFWLKGTGSASRQKIILSSFNNPCRNNIFSNIKKFPSSHRNGGQGTTELALLMPILFGLFFAAAQVIIYLQSSTMVQYASFVGARSFQVYGDRNLKSIGYRKVSSLPYTNEDQTIVEAAAESVIFESLLWEQSRIKVQDQINYFNRVYEDGNNANYNSQIPENSSGVVQVNFQCASANNCDLGSGVEVSYCMPISFPGVAGFFDLIQKKDPCRVTQNGRTFSGIMVSKLTEFGREPVEK